MTKKKRHTELSPPPGPKRPWTRRDKAWVVLLALIVIVPMAWAISVTEEYSPMMKQDLMSDLYMQMIGLDRANPNLLSWDMEEENSTLVLELTVSGEATEEQIESRWHVYFLATAKNTVGLVMDYEYELKVKVEE